MHVVTHLCAIFVQWMAELVSLADPAGEEALLAEVAVETLQTSVPVKRAATETSVPVELATLETSVPSETCNTETSAPV